MNSSERGIGVGTCIRALAKRLMSLIGATILTVVAGGVSAQTASDPIAALGRLEPKNGVIRVGVPSTPEALSGSVLAELLVEEGDDVEAGQLLAITDAAPVLEARVVESKAELVHAERDAEAAHSKADETCVRATVAAREARRLISLLEQGLAAEEETEQAQGDAEARAAACTAMRVAAKVAEAAIDVARARLITKQTQLQRTQIHAPVSGRVLEVLAYPGEFVGEEGVVEIGNIERMYAIAEVYETDVSRVHVGQRATVTSDALAAPLSGTVERIRNKVQKQDEIGTDPAARRDARIIEVEILLDDAEIASTLTYLQVDVVIGT